MSERPAERLYRMMDQALTNLARVGFRVEVDSQDARVSLVEAILYDEIPFDPAAFGPGDVTAIARRIVTALDSYGEGSP